MIEAIVNMFVLLLLIANQVIGVFGKVTVYRVKPYNLVTEYICATEDDGGALVLNSDFGRFFENKVSHVISKFTRNFTQKFIYIYINNIIL